MAVEVAVCMGRNQLVIVLTRVPRESPVPMSLSNSLLLYVLQTRLPTVFMGVRVCFPLPFLLLSHLEV